MAKFNAALIKVLNEPSPTVSHLDMHDIPSELDRHVMA
jgi:hypothetical protein